VAAPADGFPIAETSQNVLRAAAFVILLLKVKPILPADNIKKLATSNNAGCEVQNLETDLVGLMTSTLHHKPAFGPIPDVHGTTGIRPWPSPRSPTGEFRFGSLVPVRSLIPNSAISKIAVYRRRTARRH
jgi:hypothetical protein